MMDTLPIMPHTGGSLRHTGPISGVAAFDKYIATAGYDNQIILWHAKTRTALARSLHDHLANQCAFSPDGKLLVSASSDYSARIWEVPSLRLKSVLLGHTDDIDMAQFSPDGQYVATCSLDRSIKIFTLDGRCVQTLTGHTGDVLSVTWTPDGKHLISCSVDGTVRQWRAPASSSQADQQCHYIDLGGVRTDTLIVTNHHWTVTGDDSGRIAIIRNGTPHFIQAHQAGIKRIVYDEAQALLATLSYDRTMAIWKFDAAGELEEVTKTSLPALVWPRSGAFSGTSTIVFGTFGSSYASFDWIGNTWDLEHVVPDTSLNAVAIFEDEIYSIGDAGTLFRNGVALTQLGSLCNFLLPFGRTILSGGQLGRLFDAISGELLYEHYSPLNCGTTFLRSGKPHAAIGSYTGEVLIFSLEENGRINFTEILKIYDNAVKGLVANEDTLFSVCASTAIAWHEIESLRQIGMLNNAHTRIVNGCCVVHGTGFASIGRDLKLRLWKSDGSGEHHTYETPHPNSVKCISASHDGKTIMTGCYGGVLAAFDVRSRTWRAWARPTSSGISSVTFDARSGQFLASSYDGSIFAVQAESIIDFTMSVQGVATVRQIPEGSTRDGAQPSLSRPAANGTKPRWESVDCR